MAKVPVNVTSGGTIYWQDPDPFMFFDLENLQSLTEVDFYLSIGNDPTLINLNGQPFSLKVAMLINEATRNDTTTGHIPGERVSKRIKFQ